MPKKDRDEITVAKSIFDEIVEITEHEETPKEARAKKGGEARAKKLTPAERSAIARKAAKERWSKPESKQLGDSALRITSYTSEANRRLPEKNTEAALTPFCLAINLQLRDI